MRGDLFLRGASYTHVLRLSRHHPRQQRKRAPGGSELQHARILRPRAVRLSPREQRRRSNGWPDPTQPYVEPGQNQSGSCFHQGPSVCSRRATRKGSSLQPAMRDALHQRLSRGHDRCAGHIAAECVSRRRVLHDVATSLRKAGSKGSLQGARAAEVHSMARAMGIR